ncbi:putative signal transduction histidine kinase [Emticicia oligotrophica DSM 17448]|uniref:histidine kinase n=1 Tax=Emticicia oligotrophica (strain DSM 17448 / CIP 109782 / MTCC 6937 / GPTSA100-15) TaxID=929562 RepID=A0ABN4AJ36_EMTOG|nr:putative signal transduction histidine kinase [Emticicia oligotrophica DSM 17448]
MLFARFVIATILLQAILLPKSLAQNLSFETITTKNGLASNNVLGIVKDSQGYLWIATNLGISRYDGYHFQSFGPMTVPNCLAISKDDILWFSNEKGLYSINTKSLVLSLKVLNNPNDSNPDNDHYNGLFIDNEGIVWSTDFHHIKSFDTKKNRLTTYRILEKNQRSPDIAKFVEDKQHTLWSISPIGLCKFDKIAQKWIRVISNRDFTSLAYDSFNQTFWLSNTNAQLLQFNHTTKNVVLKGTLSENIEKIQISDKNELWCISKNHLFQYQVNKEKFQEINPLDETEVILNTLFVDTSNTEIWLGSNEGILKKLPNNQLIRQVLIPKNIINKATSVRCFESIDEQNFLLATSTGELLSWHQTSNIFKKIYQFAQHEINAIKSFKNMRYIATDKGLYAQKANSQPQKILASAINDITLDNQNRLWILIPNETIKVLNLSTNQFSEPWKKLPYPNFFKENLFLKLHFSNTGHIWIAGWIPSGFGIARFNLKTNEFQELSSINDHKKFVTDYYLNVSETSKGDLLFSGYGGYNRLNRQGIIVEEIHAEEKKPIFADGQCFAIGEDLNENTYVGTAEGIVRISKKHQLSRFTQFDGLLNNDIRNGFLMTENQLLIGHKNSFSILNLQNNYIHTHTQQLKLSEISILGSNQKANLSSPLRFTRQQNTLSFAFSPLNFENQAKNKFRYRLNDINEQWIENGNNQTITFSNLKQGEYQLEVQYAEITGNWNTKSLIINFTILPAWYETWWFRIALALLGLGVGYGIYWYRINEFKKLQAIRNRISSDLHDEIGASLSSISILGGLVKQKLDEKHPGYSFAQMIHDEAKQAGTAIDYIIWNINPQFDSLESLFTRINSEASEIIEAKGIIYEFEATDLGSKNISIDKKRNIYLICKELINNALKHSQCNKISLKCEVKNKNLYLSFSDNGIGFDSSISSNRNGVKNIKARLQELQGSYQIISEEGQGTTYLMNIPI